MHYFIMHLDIYNVALEFVVVVSISIYLSSLPLLFGKIDLYSYSPWMEM